MANGSAPAPRYWVRGELDISRRRNVGHRPSKPCTERPCSVLRRAMWGDIRSRVPRCVPKLGRGNPETARVYRSQSRTGRPRSARPAIQPTATEARRGSLALCGSAVAMHRTRLRPRPSGRAARWSPLAHRGEGSARGRPSGRQRVQRCRCLSDTEQVDRGVTVLTEHRQPPQRRSLICLGCRAPDDEQHRRRLRDADPWQIRGRRANQREIARRQGALEAAPRVPLARHANACSHASPAVH
jgi:hypothetical protein